MVRAQYPDEGSKSRSGSRMLRRQGQAKASFILEICRHANERTCSMAYTTL